MGVIKGRITNKIGEPIDKAMVALKDKNFVDLYVTYTDEEGIYKLEVKNREYPYLIAVKDYAVKNLEFWCQDISLNDNLEINASIDKLEIYGLKVFKVDGGYPALMVYFRPMSLVKYLKKQSDIFPNIGKIEVEINNEISEIYVINEVREFAGDGEAIKACLLNVSLHKENLKLTDNYLSVQIVDTDGNLGQAGTYFTLSK